MGRSKLTSASVTGIFNFEWEDRRGLKHGTLVLWAVVGLVNFGIFLGALFAVVFGTVDAINNGVNFWNVLWIVIGLVIVFSGLANNKKGK